MRDSDEDELHYSSEYVPRVNHHHRLSQGTGKVHSTRRVARITKDLNAAPGSLLSRSTWCHELTPALGHPMGRNLKEDAINRKRTRRRKAILAI